jgi:hypothetical protein
MNAFLVFLLEPPTNPFLQIPSAPIGANLKEFDFIEHWYKRKDFTHAWNEFGLRTEVVERLL